MDVEAAIRSRLTFSLRAGASLSKPEPERSQSRSGGNLFRTCPKGVCSSPAKGHQMAEVSGDLPPIPLFKHG